MSVYLDGVLVIQKASISRKR